MTTRKSKSTPKPKTPKSPSAQESLDQFASLTEKVLKIERVIAALVSPLHDDANDSTQAGIEHLRARIRDARGIWEA